LDTILLEIAKHIGRPIDTVCTLLENILSIPTKRLGDLLGDQIVYWQWSNRIKILEKASAKIAAKGIKMRILPQDFVVPFIRDCGDAENQDLQEWWAEMLASSIQDDSLNHIGFVKTLQAMSPGDVKCMDTLISIAYVEKQKRVKAIAEASGMSVNQVAVSFHNLQRLGFFTATAWRLTPFAFDFLNACYPHRERIEVYHDEQSKIPYHLVSD
jgi:hypothetical protein